MSSKRIQTLLTELNRELHTANDFDPETRELLRQLNDDIDELAGSNENPAVERARELETRFAADHPVAERITREIADLLSKMGI
jgi:hypothetical protein